MAGRNQNYGAPVGRGFHKTSHHGVEGGLDHRVRELASLVRVDPLESPTVKLEKRRIVIRCIVCTDVPRSQYRGVGARGGWTMLVFNVWVCGKRKCHEAAGLTSN